MNNTPKIALLSGLLITGLGLGVVHAQTKKPAVKKAVSQNTASAAGFKKLKGIKYKIVKDLPGKKAAIGDVVEYNLIVKQNDSVLFDTHKTGKPTPDRVSEVKGSGQWQAVYPLVTAGDSVIVEISCDTIIKNIPTDKRDQLPPWLAKGKKITLYMSFISIKSMEEYKKDMEAKEAAQGEADDKILQDYFAKNNIKATKIAAGLYYTIEKDGAGNNITAGETVTINYTGRTLDGNIFDSNVDSSFEGMHHVKPFDFVPGNASVIKGWEEGILLLKKGTKATLYIPSPLAYGSQSPAPSIPANAILIFSMDVLDVKAADKNHQ